LFMFLVELVLQGVRGVRELVRLRFKGGLNLIVAGNESGKTTAADSIQRLLFPRNRTDLLDSLISTQAPAASRAALVICSDEGTYYRIIQDFSKRAVNLSKYNAASKDFSLLHKDWDSAAQFMVGMTAGILEEDYARIFIVQRERNAPRTEMPVSVSAPRALPGTPVPSEAMKPSANSGRLAELREALRKAEEAADADYKYQSAKLSLEEIEKKINALEEMERKKGEIDSTLASLEGYDGLPEDLAGLIDDHERRQGQKLVDTEELGKQIQDVNMQLGAIPTVNFVANKLFIAGVVVGVVSILAGVFVITDDLAYLFPIGVLLSLLLMAIAWYNGTRKSARRKNLLREEEDLKQELVELEKRFQQEGATVIDALRSTGAASPAELKEKAVNYRYFLSLKADIEEQRQRGLGDQDLEVLRQQYEQQRLESAELEKAAQAVAQNNIDTYSIRQDIERLDAEASAASGGVSWNFGTEQQELPAFVPDSVTGGRTVGFLEEIRIASRIGGIEMETLVPAVEAAAQRNLASITAGKYVRLEAGHEGEPIVHARDESVVDYAALSHGTRSLIYFCLRTGLVEALAGKRRLPFILDDPLADLDPARQQAAGQVLRALGAKTQVILFTSNPALSADGDVTMELK
jgi:hypothetical protein